MSMKTKTKRRLALAAGVVALAGVAGTGFVLASRWQGQRTTEALRASGLEAAAKGDTTRVINDLGSYLRRRENDAEALLLYGRARRDEPLPNAENLRQAARVLGRYRQLRPDDEQAGLELLRLHVLIGEYQEARALAPRLRPAEAGKLDRDHLPVLREEVAALAALRDRDRTAAAQLEPILARALELEPLDTEFRLAQLELMRAARKQAEAAAMFDALALAHADDPRPKLFVLLAKTPLQDPRALAAQFPQLCEIAGLQADPPNRVRPAQFPDKAFAQRLAALFDLLGKFDHTELVLREAATILTDEELTTRWLVRALQAGRVDLVIRWSTPERLASPAIPSEHLAYAALTRFLVGQNRESEALMERLAARTGDYRARAWVSGIKYFGPLDDAAMRDAIAPFRQTMQDYSYEPFLRSRLAEFLTRLGRIEDARAEWRELAALPSAVGWARPWIALSELAAGEGRWREASAHAAEAFARQPRNVQAGMARFRAGIGLAAARPGVTPEAQSMLRFAELAEDEISRLPAGDATRAYLEDLLVGRVFLLARLGRGSDAEAVVRAALESKSPPSANALERLASIARQEGLSVEGECIAAFGADADAVGVAAAKAWQLVGVGKNDEAIRLLREGLAKAGPGDATRWGMAHATLLEALDIGEAREAWITLADANPQDLNVQRAALGSRFACADEAFVQRTAERVSKLAGGQRPSVLVAIARARAMLSGAPDSSRRDQAVAALRGILNENPQSLEARDLLVEALLLNEPAKGVKPSMDDAITELKAAAEIAPGPGPYLTRVAQLLQGQQKYERVRDELRPLIRDTSTDDASLRRAAEILAAQGADEDALPALQALATRKGEKAAPELLLSLARVQVRLGRVDDAIALYRRLALVKDLPLDAIPQVATGLMQGGDRPAGERVLASLDERDTTPSRRLMIRARVAEIMGDPRSAESLLLEATTAQGADEEAWIECATFLVRQASIERATKVIADGLKAQPESTRLKALDARVRLSGNETDARVLAQLADILAADKDRVGDAEIIRAVQLARDTGKLADDDTLIDLSERFPRSLAVQNLVVRQLMAISPPRPDVAARLASRAIANFPASPEPARLAAGIHSSLGHWHQALSAARAWKNRDAGAGAEADVAIARAHLALDQPRPALTQIRPLLAAALADPEQQLSFAILDAYLRADLMHTGGDESAAAVSRIVEQSRPFRNEVWLRAAATSTPTVEKARDWIAKARKFADESNPDDRVAFASAYSLVGARFPQTGARDLDEAVRLLLPLAEKDETATPGVLNMLAITQRRAARNADALATFRRVVARNPNDVLALANLSEMLMQGGSPAELAEALRHAEHAFRVTGGAEFAIAQLLASSLAALGEQALVAGNEAEGRQLAIRAVELYSGLSEESRSDLALHSALAYAAELADQPEKSIEAYERVIALPGVTKQAKADAQCAIAVIKSLSTEGDDYSRAESLANAAARADAGPSRTIAQAQVSIARGRRPQAISALRPILESTPDRADALIPMIAALSAGNAVDVGEARELIRKFDSGAVKTPASPLLRRQLEGARRRMGMAALVDP